MTNQNMSIFAATRKFCSHRERAHFAQTTVNWPEAALGRRKADGAKRTENSKNEKQKEEERENEKKEGKKTQKSGDRYT